MWDGKLYKTVILMKDGTKIDFYVDRVKIEPDGMTRLEGYTDARKNREKNVVVSSSDVLVVTATEVIEGDKQ